MINLSYLGYLLKTTTKKKMTFITGIVYYVFFLIMILFVPLLTDQDSTAVWANPNLGLQVTLIIILAIFCASVVVVIYKDPIDDGSELLILSKPLSRASIINTKTLAYFIIVTIFTIISFIFLTFAFLTPTFNGKFYWSFVLSITVATLLISFVFGGISILLSLKFNKIFTIMISLFVVIILCIIQLISFILASPPLIKTMSDGYSKTTCRAVVLNENQFSSDKNYVVFTGNENEKGDENKPNSIWNIGPVAYWDLKNKESNWYASLWFNPISQMLQIYNLGSLNSYLINYGNEHFAGNIYSKYTLDSPTWLKVFDDQTEGKQIVKMNLADSNLPVFYFNSNSFYFMSPYEEYDKEPKVGWFDKKDYSDANSYKWSDYLADIAARPNMIQFFDKLINTDDYISIDKSSTSWKADFINEEYKKYFTVSTLPDNIISTANADNLPISSTRELNQCLLDMKIYLMTQANHYIKSYALSNQVNGQCWVSKSEINTLLTSTENLSEKLLRINLLNGTINSCGSSSSERYGYSSYIPDVVHADGLNKDMNIYYLVRGKNCSDLMSVNLKSDYVFTAVNGQTQINEFTQHREIEPYITVIIWILLALVVFTIAVECYRYSDIK